MHDLEGPHVLETLSGVGGVDTGFVGAHVRRKGYRPCGCPTVGGRARWWSWEYPGTTLRRGARDGRYREDVSFLRVSLWSSSRITVLLCDRPDAPPPARIAPPPKRRHQDATATGARLRGADQHGATRTAEGRVPSPTEESRSLEAEIYESLGGHLRAPEHILGHLVYERWLDLLEALGSRACRGYHDDRVLWASLASLEQNQDTSRHLAKEGRSLDTPSAADWTDLIARVHRRLSLSMTGNPQRRQQQVLPQSSSSGRPDERRSADNDDGDRRSLDRISYLGGILLPVTVVSGILAIEGDYGPEGGNFWVFWVASVVASAAAVLVIYVDQVRTLNVWMEVAVDALMEEDPDVVEDEEGGGDGRFVVQRWKDGELVRAWQRKELGWGGAVKKVCGYYRIRGHPPGMQFEAPRTDGRVD